MDRIPRKIILTVLIVLFLLAASISLMLAFYIYEPQISNLLKLAAATNAPTVTPTCIRPTLTLGAYIYTLDEITVSDENILPIVPGPAGMAWWVSDTINPYVIIFEPATRSLDLKSVLIPGDQMEIKWADCTTEEFVLTDLATGLPDFSSLLQQTGPGVNVLVQPVGTEGGYVLHGQQSVPINPLTP